MGVIIVLVNIDNKYRGGFIMYEDALEFMVDNARTLGQI